MLSHFDVAEHSLRFVDHLSLLQTKIPTSSFENSGEPMYDSIEHVERAILTPVRRPSCSLAVGVPPSITQLTKVSWWED